MYLDIFPLLLCALGKNKTTKSMGLKAKNIYIVRMELLQMVSESYSSQNCGLHTQGCVYPLGGEL